MELELPVIIVLTVIVVAVAYALGLYVRRQQGVFPPPAPLGHHSYPPPPADLMTLVRATRREGTDP